MFFRSISVFIVLAIFSARLLSAVFGSSFISFAVNHHVIITNITSFPYIIRHFSVSVYFYMGQFWDKNIINFIHFMLNIQN
jgi:hypothetical protein